MIHKRLYIIVLVISLFVISCKYEDQYTGDPNPVIFQIAVNQTAFKQFTDTVVISFNYRDGDGDLGFESADSLSVEIRDIRFAKPDYYHLRPLAPAGSRIAISGKINVALKNVFLLGSGVTESTQFQIRIKDRAQHWSNTLVSKSVNINK